MRAFIYRAIIFLALQLVVSARNLPVYIEDSHTGSFGFFAQTLDLDKSYTLILIDAHSDASGVPGSDRVRDAIRRVNSMQQRDANIAKLRAQGTLQPFNWIEPLLPKPIEKVIWIAGESLTDAELETLQKEARVHLDWHTQAEPRATAMLAERYVVTDWSRFKTQLVGRNLGDLVVSIDLDYFVGVAKPIENLNQKWNAILMHEKLEAVSFALSMPWQKDKKMANALLHSALENALSVRASEIQFEPFLTDINDRSEMAKSYYRKGQKPPRYDIYQAPLRTRQLMIRHQSRIKVTHNPLAFDALLRLWHHGGNQNSLEIRSAQKSIDGVWRIRRDQLDDVWLKDRDHAVLKVRWWLHQPHQSSYNILPKSGLGKGFGAHSPSYILSQRRMVAETEDLALSSRTWRQFLPSENETGIVRIQAELVREGGSTFTDVMELRVRNRDGFIGALEEQFGSPYVFGIGSMKHAGESGPETLLGNDCANFLVYAFRRTGRQIPWCNPVQLKKYLEPVKGKVKEGDVIHLGSHVAVLYQDRGELGKLEKTDILGHHLGGFPELLTLEELAKDRAYAVMRLKPNLTKNHLWMGGDVCLYKLPVNKELPDYFFKQQGPPRILIANLECVISDRAQPLMKKPFNFIIPVNKASFLKQFTLLSLANNHAADGGVEGLRDTIQWLDQNGIKHIGAGALKPATAVKVIDVAGQKIGFLAMNLIETDVFPAAENSVGVATYPAHKKEISQSIQAARKAGVTMIIAMPHWGDEYTSKVNDQQRSLAQWLIKQGVDAVVGSHPHTLQPTEYYRGKPIIYSLGNFIFAPQNRPGFNKRSILKLYLSNDAEIHEVESLKDH